MSVVGKNIPHDSAKGHVTGESVFIDDMPFAKNELIVDFVGSPYAHGELISIDTSEAEKIDGIIGIYTHKDLAVNKFGPIIQDEHLLVENIATFWGEPIVVIAGENKKAVELAKKAVKIEMKKLEPVFTIDDAIKKEQYLGVPRSIKTGNVEEAFKVAENILEGTFINGGQEHFYLESQASIAYPGENDTLVIHSSTQHPSEIVQVASALLGLQQNQVICITKRMGGGFGGKESQACHFAVMAGLVALKTKRPARIILTKDMDMKVTGKRHPFQNNYKVAFTKEGLITALKVNLFSNGGAAADLSTSILERAMLHSDGAYYIPKRNSNSFYILDGFQRLSTLIGCLLHPQKAKLKGIVRDEKEWFKEFNIVYNLKDQLFEMNRSKDFESLKNFQIPIYKLVDGKEFFNFQKSTFSTYIVSSACTTNNYSFQFWNCGHH
ncbi:MAG: molybdopterin cofactor-binding domain-containing protein [Candidatus Sericytochromatia bacterium]